MVRRVSDLAAPPPATVTPVPVPPWRRAFLAGLYTWAVAMVSYLLLNAVFWTMAQEPAPPGGDFLGVWDRWDTGHYLTIATTGYNPHTENPAFFPLYPLLIHIVKSVLPGSALTAGLVVASIACIVALAVIYRLVEDLFGGEVAGRTALYLMASPFAFYLVAAYNESLFIALAVGSLYCMRRGHWWWAGLLAGVSSAARQAGLLLALAFVIEYLRQRNWQLRWVRSDVLAVLLVPTGLIAFAIYSGMYLGDPLKFVHVQAFWGRELSVPWKGVVGALEQASAWAPTSPMHPDVVLNVIDLVTVPIVLALLVLSVVGPWRLGQESWYLIVFAAATFITVLLTPIGPWLPPLHGVPRYALEVLPIFIVLARMGRHRAVDRAYLFPSVALQAALLIGFFADVWLS
jgi:Gpi18-like mannosyltransferase